MIARKSSAGILNRLLGPESENWSPDVARAIVRLDFVPGDHQRVAELSEKAQSGALSVEEREELDDYVRVADLLAILQSKARTCLQRAGESTASP